MVEHSLDLFTGKATKETAIRLAFDKFHVENPHVYVWLLDKARTAKRKGFQHYSMRTLLHLLRWHAHIETNDPNFKINDHHSPYYARMIMTEHPEFKGFFALRELTAE